MLCGSQPITHRPSPPSPVRKVGLRWALCLEKTLRTYLPSEPTASSKFKDTSKDEEKLHTDHLHQGSPTSETIWHGADVITIEIKVLDECNALCVCVCVLVVQLCPILQTVAHQAPLFMEFSRQENWGGLPCPPPGDPPDPGIEPKSHVFCTGRQVLYH